MKYNFVGETGLAVSEFGFGTMSFGAEADEQMAAKIYALCRDRGINFFDCANMYSKGRAEEILGKLLRHERNQIVLSTKAYFPMGDGANDRGLSRYHLVQAVEDSLRRLGTDRIDLFFLHRADDFVSMEELSRGVEELVRSGKILYPAVSNFSAWQSMELLSESKRWGRQPIVACQPMYNLIKRQAEVEILPWAQAHKIAVFPYSPLAAGLLTGKYNSKSGEGRIRENETYKARYGEPIAMDVAENFCELAKELGYPPVALAIAWVASHPAVTAPLLGARNLDQLEGAFHALSIQLSWQERAKISAVGVEPAPATDRNEEGSHAEISQRVVLS